MINLLAMWIGYIVIICFGLVLIGVMLWIAYLVYDNHLKKLLDWGDVQVREDMFYFIRHKEKIREYIKKQGRQ